tara:strand:- start:945 stop:1046 length:102 start_codon:yes stop_codon:yes gene_type:complete
MLQHGQFFAISDAPDDHLPILAGGHQQFVVAAE